MENNQIWEEKSYTQPLQNNCNQELKDNHDTTFDTKKDLIKNGLKDGEKVSGIYKIINKINGKYYVGSSMDMFREPHGRWPQHKRHLRANVNQNPHLQSAWNKYGEENFKFCVIESINSNKEESVKDFNKRLKLLEQKYLEIAKLHKNNVYNMSFIAERCEWTDKMKKEKSISMKGKNNPNYGNGYKIQGKNNPYYGKKHTDEIKHKMSMNHQDVNGLKNPQADKKTYKFLNINTNEIYEGHRCKFIKLFNLDASTISGLIRRKYKHHRGWIICPS